MLLPLLLAAALEADPAATPPSAETTRFALAVEGNAAVQSDTYGNAANDSNANGQRAGGNLDFTFYLGHPLVDDDAPRSLQPFLQRTSTLALHGGGLYEHVDYSLRANGGAYRQDYTDESIATRVFILDNVALLGSLGVNYLHDARVPDVALPTSRNVLEPEGSIGVDVRSGDSSLALSWQLVGVHQESTQIPAGAWRDVFWPRLSLAGRTVLGHQYDLTASIVAIPDGIEARAGLGIYPTKDLGFSAALEVDHGQIYLDNATDYDRVFGNLGVSYWILPRVNAGLTYTPTRVSWATNDQWSQQLSVSLTARLP